MGRKMLLAYAAVGMIALGGVGTALAASGKAKAHKSSAATTTETGGAEGGRPGPGGPGGGPGGPGGGPGGPPAVHSESVVLNKAGTAFITVTTDSGIVKSVEGSKLAIEEGTKTVTYKTATLTISGEAKVILDGKTSTLSALAAGDHVMVCSSSEGTVVMAADSSFQPEGPPPGGPTGPGGVAH